MTIGDLVGLMDLVRSLVGSLLTGKSGLDRQFFFDFVQPTWDCFQRLHSDYISTFSEYAASLSSGDQSLSILADRVRADSVSSEHLRTELSVLADQLANWQGVRFSAKRESLVREYVDSIATYFYPVSAAEAQYGHYDKALAPLFRDLYSAAESAKPTPMDLSLQQYCKLALRNTPRIIALRYLILSGSNSADLRSRLARIQKQLQDNYQSVFTYYLPLREEFLT